MATIDLGKVALVWKGTYAAGTTYESKDVVQFTDSGELSSYIYVNASGASGQTPSTGGTVNSTYWDKMAGGTSLAVGNNKIITTDGSGNVSSLSLGTAGQVVKVNSGANGLEFGDDSTGKVKQIKTGVATSSTSSSVNVSSYSNTAMGNVGVAHVSVNITPVSATSKLLIMANAPSGTGNNGVGSAGVFVDGACRGLVSTNGYSADASGVTITAWADSSSTSQKTVQFRAIGEWSGSAMTLGQIRNGHTTSMDGMYGTLIVMEVE